MSLLRSTDDEDYMPGHLETGRSRHDSSSSESDDDLHQIQSLAQSVPSSTNKKIPIYGQKMYLILQNVFRGKYLEQPDNFQMPSPLEFFKQYLTDDMLDLLVANTNQYSVQKSGKSINTSNKEFEQVIGMFLKMGLVKMPCVRCYWETESCYAPVANVKSRNRFQIILSSLHFIDNNIFTDDDKTG
ncbi:piggyBac transposable element-derived protein 3 [Biomphalaria glabrata]|nr:piggyBac transposable element-derived protein 3 [Biomphalaria glabrata]